MNSSSQKPPDDQALVFAQEPDSLSEKAVENETPENYKLLVVDDDNEVHVMTKLVLSDYEYQGAGLEFLSAFSAKQAKEVLRKHSDIACCLLDVVMEKSDSGLEVAKFIREKIKDHKLRIILRTGQPGKAPEKEIIVNYEINDYKEKTELTSQKLFTSITTALRSYIHLVELQQKTRLIQDKNTRLNQEIARRIVAESNLAKYNRSLEKLVETKSSHLEKALAQLDGLEKVLGKTRKKTLAADVYPDSIEAIEDAGLSMEANLDVIEDYRSKMTQLLEKYLVLHEILSEFHEDSGEQLDCSGILQEIEMFREKIDINTLIKRYPDIIMDCSRGIDVISRAVSDIKRFTAVGEEPSKDCDFNRFVEERAKDIRERFPKEVGLQLDLENLPVARLPEEQMASALNAVVENAFQAIGKRGVISLSTRYDAPDIILTVSDLGCGIAQKDLPRVFTPYFKRFENDGKGLGLTLAKSVVTACNGQIAIESTVNEGTTVTIRLPAKASRQST